MRNMGVGILFRKRLCLLSFGLDWRFDTGFMRVSPDFSSMSLERFRLISFCIFNIVL